MDLATQYGTSANLAARIALHQQCSTNPYGLQRWVLDRLQLADGQRVLEIACGTGSLWRENADRIPAVDLVLTDLSLAMIETTRRVVPRARFASCALPELPFASGSFDVVIANHMLYHVADRQRGLEEIRRVLRSDGVLYATTNGVEHLREIRELMRDFGLDDGSHVSAPFTLENGLDQLRAVFANVSRTDYEDSLRVTDPELLVAYIASIGGVRDGMREAIAGRMREGVFEVRKATGIFVAR